MEEEFEGDLKKIDPRRIIDPKKSNNDIDNFFLVLGLVFNDLKGIVLFERMLLEKFRKPEFVEVSIQCGEYNGFSLQISKVFGGIINEFFKFLSKNKKILLKGEFQQI